MPPHPELASHLGFTWASFWRLSLDRRSDIVIVQSQAGTITRQVHRPIPTLPIHDWCDRHGLGGDDIHAFRMLIDRMDMEWRAAMEEREAANASHPPPG